MSIGTPGNKISRQPEEFELQLQRQLGFLERSCRWFDSGYHDEAVRIAVTIRVLVHDHPRSSTSLLEHLGVKETLSYVDTGIYRSLLDSTLQTFVSQPGSKIASSNPADVGLVEIGDAGAGRVGWYAPLRLRRFDPGHPLARATRGVATFSPWWTDPLVESISLKTFSRKNLVLIMANQDGGAHVDAGIDADYRELELSPLMHAEYGQNLKDKTLGGDIPEALYNVAFASVRQIAFELLWSIKRGDYLKATPGSAIQADPYKGMPVPPNPPHLQLTIPSLIQVITS